MNILHVTKKYPDALGGDAVVVAQLQAQQEQAGHRVAIVTSNCSEIKTARQIYKCGLHDTPARLDAITIRRLLSLMLLFFQIFDIIRREKPDVIHTHSVDMAYCIALAARWYRVPVIHTFHIVTFYDTAQSALRRKTELWLARRVQAKHITAPNRHDVQKLQAAGLDQAVLLANGVDMDFWSYPDNRIRHTDFTFLAVGRLEQQKGYDYLLQAAALLAQKGIHNFRIIIAGTGSQEAALRSQSRTLGLQHHVQFVGRKSPAEIRDLLAGANAAIFSALYETTPLTLLEAWASGTPAITTTVGIVRQPTADFSAAYTVPPRQSRALMQAMRACMTDHRARTLIAARGKQEARQYAWPTIARSAEMLYRSVC